MKLNIRKIQLELERLGWSKSKLAREMGVTRQCIHYYFHNKRNIGLETVTNIGKTLGIPAKDLIE